MGEAVAKTSYGIYTIERLPKGSRRTPKWDLHSTAKDRKTAEDHAKTLAEQLYFDHVEVQEFKTCPKTQKRVVSKIKSYSRRRTKKWLFACLACFSVGIVAISLFL